MKKRKVKLMALLTAIVMLFGSFGGTAVFASAGTALGAEAACNGHELGNFSGVPACVNADGHLHVCQNNFPDGAFRTYIQNMTSAADGYITAQECEEITGIDVNYNSISSLKGVEFFTALEELYCYENRLTDLDISNNTALKYLYCSYNSLASLDVSSNTALRDLDCSSNQLTTLDISGCTALVNLWCLANQLTSLDVRNNTALEYLSCSSNQLTSLDVRNNTALTALDCALNQLTELNVSTNTALEDLDCNNNRLTDLDISGCTALEYLSCYTNQLTSLDISGCTALEDLKCNSNQLTSLDVRNNTALEYLSCSSNQLTELNVSNNTVLGVLYCNNNQLIELNVSNNTALESLFCSENHLATLDISGCTALGVLYCYNNQLIELNVSNNTALWNFWCSDNQLTELDVSNNSALWYLDCSSQETELELCSADGKYTANLGDIISADNFSKVTSVSDGSFNVKSGIVTFDNQPDSFTYTYDTGKEPMDVTVVITGLKSEPKPEPKPEPIDSSEKFTDIAQGKWYKEYVDYVATYGLMNGMSENTFEPNTELSRAMFVQILANMNGVDTTDRAVKTQFTDVPSGKWYTSAVKWAVEEGIVNGISPTEFGPSEPIQRQQMCVMLVRYAQAKNITLKTDVKAVTFADDSLIQSYAKDAVYACQQAGIVSGMTPTEFQPRDSATRGQIAKIISVFHDSYMTAE